MNNLFLKILTFFISLIDYLNKRKVLSFFKKKFKKKSLNIIDIGAHKGETIDLLLKNFNINKIFSFEPNSELYFFLKSKKKYNNNKIKIFNNGVGLKPEIRELNIFRDTQSSTFNTIDLSTDYFLRKKRIISFFSQNRSFIRKKQKINIINLSDLINEEKIDEIDLLKIDTEGYEYNILKGIKDNHFDKINYIYFEHHFDLMIKKNYKFFDIDHLLRKKNFFQKIKLRMKFRKSFEYIYENSKKNIS